MNKLLIPLALITLLACNKKKPAAKAHDAAVDRVSVAEPPPGIRLSDDVTPLAYRVALTVDPKLETFHGTAEIDVTIVASTPGIWIHVGDLTITKAEIVRGAVVDALDQTRGDHDRVALTAAGEQAPGPATLRFTFDGVQDAVRTHGIRRRLDRGDWYVVTQLEATGARRVFPCFDEPRWKVPFELTLTVPAGDLAVANAPIASEDAPAGGTRTVRFAPTPPVPTYLVAFAVGPFEAVDAGQSRTGTPVRIIVPKGRAADAAYAVAEFPKIQADLEDYLGSPYPYAKLDHLVIPSQPRGAMENPGMITYPPRYLLIDEHGDRAARALIVGIAAHELAHMWFGDLVTMAWWDDLWLNEAFATWASSKIVMQRYPDLGGPSLIAAERRTALEADGQASARRIRQPVTTADELDAAFDGITYQKGATVIRMFERWVGEDAFQAGIRAYLGEHAWKNATSTEFLAAIGAAAKQDVATAFGTFLDQGGAPVIEVAVECPEGGQASLRLKQRRHLVLGAAPAGAVPRWQIPVCVRTSEEPDARCMLLSDTEGTLELGPRCPKWVAPNAGGAGYYRAALAPPYDRALLAAPLEPAERAAAAVDLSLAVDAGEVDLGVLLDTIPTLAASDERVTREVAVARLEGLAPIVADADRAAFEALVVRTFGKPAMALGWKPSPSDSVADAHLRGRILALATDHGGAGFANQAEELATAWIADHAVVPVALWPDLLTAAVRARPDAVFEPLFTLATTDADAIARRAILTALGSVDDVPRLTRVLDLLLAVNPTPPERLGVLSRARTPATQAAVLDYLQTHQAKLLTHLGEDWHGRLVYAPCLAQRRDEIATWLTAELAPREAIGALPVAQAIEAMDQCLAVRGSLAPQLAEALSSRP